MPGTNGNGTWRSVLLALLVSAASAGIIGWAAANQATRDYTIKDEQRDIDQERRIAALEVIVSRIDANTADTRTSVARIEGYLKAERR